MKKKTMFPVVASEAPKLCTKIRRLMIVLITLACGLVAASPPAMGVTYDFTLIADTTGPFKSITGTPSINNDGTVAFSAGWAGTYPGGRIAVYTGSGGTLTTIVDSADGVFGTFSLGATPAINDAGTVAFFGVLAETGQRGIFTGDGTSITTIVTEGDPFTGSFGFTPSINNAGTVAFTTGLVAGGFGVFTGSGGQITTIATTAGPFNTVQNPDINNSGTVAFSGALDPGPLPQYVASGTGEPFTIIAQTGVGGFTLLGLLNVAINDAGVVAFRGFNPTAGFFTGSGGPVTTIANNSGPLNIGLANSRVALNNLGEVAFLANLDTGVDGIFTAIGPNIQKVIGQGDGLFGSTIGHPTLPFLTTGNIGFFRDGLNDSGQLTFWARLTDGREVIARATPAGAISLSKTANRTNICNGSNSLVTYTYVVTNNSSSFNVSGSVSDDQLGDIGSFGPLAPGASATFTKVATVNGTVTNTGTATGTFDDTPSTQASASASATVTGHACTTSLSKTPSTADVCNGSNTLVTYTYVVTNNSSSFSVTGSVNDDQFGSIGSFGPLAPGRTATLVKTATVTGTVTNTGTATGTFNDPVSTQASASASATVTGHPCTTSITKTPSTANVCNASNTQATYTYVVTNNSDFFSVSGSVSDDQFGSVGSFGPLAPGASATLTSMASVNGTVTNTGTATGTFNDTASTQASATASATVRGHVCTISITKTPSATEVCNGLSVTYTYAVINNSDFFTWSGSLVDDVNGSINGSFSLSNGQTKTFTASDTIVGTVTNNATASGAFNDPNSTSASASASATVNGINCGIVTNSSLCTFDVDTSSGDQFRQFRLIFTPDQNNPTTWKLNASNPGQFYYNILHFGTGDTTLSIDLPYPFVTQGAVPIHIFSEVTASTENGFTCFEPGTEIGNSPTQVTLSSYSPQQLGSTASVDVTVPAGFAYIIMHLDYGLKGTTGYSKNAANDAVNANNTSEILIADKENYTFSDSSGGSDTIQSRNVFKRDPGIGGLVLEEDTDDPVENVRVQIYNSSNKLLATVYTDKDGWYMWQYKYTGKPATFTVKLPDDNLAQNVTLKANGFLIVNFTVPLEIP